MCCLLLVGLPGSTTIYIIKIVMVYGTKVCLLVHLSHSSVSFIFLWERILNTNCENCLWFAIFLSLLRNHWKQKQKITLGNRVNWFGWKLCHTRVIFTKQITSSLMNSSLETLTGNIYYYIQFQHFACLMNFMVSKVKSQIFPL